MAIVDELILAVIGGALSGLLAIGVVLWLVPRGRPRPPAPDNVLAEPRRFHFRDGYLIDQSDNVAFLLPQPINHLKAWAELVDALSDVSDDVPKAFADLRDRGRALRIEGAFGRDQVLILGARQGRDIHVSVSTADADETALRVDRATLSGLEMDLETLGQAHATSPDPAWAIDREGQVIWANDAYIALARRCLGPDAACAWPMPALFPGHIDMPTATARRDLTDRRGQVHWYETFAAAPNDQGNRFHHARSLEGVIAAETARRSLLQTLSRTFADLPTGLAIFNADGTLAQFNPALLDMTGLDPEWLSRHPTVADVFDALRDRQRLPEPRNYKAWRDRMAGMAADDASEPYRETWSLADGTTYRVTGRAQGDGSVTLMFEDVTADLSAARDAQADRVMLTSLLDAVDHGLVAFDMDGRRLSANAAARALWCGSAETDLPETLDACITLWQGRCHPSPAWGDLRTFGRAANDPEATEWSETLRSALGNPIEMRVTPLGGGRLSIAFIETVDVVPMLSAEPLEEMAEPKRMPGAAMM